MKRLAIILLLWSVNTASFGQMTPPFPTVDGKINFSDIVAVEGAGKDELYERAKIWFADAFVSSNSVIQLANKERGLIMGKGVATERNEYWEKRWNFTIKIQIKDEKYKVEVYDIHYSFLPDLSKQAPNMRAMMSFSRIEEQSLDALYADRKRMYDKKGSGLKKGFSTILANSTNAQFNALLESLNKQISSGVVLDDF